MVKSVLFICFFILLLNEASAQEVVQGFIRGSAVLPCHPGNRQLTHITAHWRYEDRKNVYDILNGQGATKEQDPEYSGRTETFPAELSKGNFTIRLTNLKKSDEGPYCCFITEFGLENCINLQVKVCSSSPAYHFCLDQWRGLGADTCNKPFSEEVYCDGEIQNKKPREIQMPGSSSGGETTAGRIASLLIPLFSVTLQLCV